MNSDKSDVFFEISLILLAIGVFMFIGYMLYISFAMELEEECLKYENEYGYDTMLVGNFWSWDGTLNCLVLMEDGTKVELQDFDISDYKKPKVTVNAA